MGGFEAPGTGNVLDFTGTPYEGLEVTVDSASVGLLMDIMGDYEAITAEDVNVKAALPVMSRLLGNFGELLESWNVTKRGKPVPASAEGLRSLDIHFAMAVIGAWLTGTTGADEELGKDSSSGGSSQEALTAAAALSSSLTSSPGPRL
jgi:hypothetical protein